MGFELNTLDMLDLALMGGGVLVLAVSAVRWRQSRWTDPLANVPDRRNELSVILVWTCLLTLVGGGALGMALATQLTPAALSDATREAWIGVLAMTMAQLLTGVACVIVARVAGLGLLRPSPFGLPRQLFESLAGCLAALYVCGLVVWYTGWLTELLWPDYQPPAHTVFSALNAPETPIWMRVVAVGGAAVLAPLSEELFFRGILQTALAKALPLALGVRAGRWVAIALTATVFGLLHAGTPQFIPALICLGVILGYLYERHGTLIVPILVHALFNARSLLWYHLGGN